MSGTNAKLIAAVEKYFTALQQVRASGGATDERSYYPPLSNLLNAIGDTLSPKVHCVSELADHGAGRPDFGLYTKKRTKQTRPLGEPVPEHGVGEVKPADEDLQQIAGSEQVRRYWACYRLVLVTNTRAFALVGEDASGQQAQLETFTLAASAADFERLLEHLRKAAQEHGLGLGEYLRRVMSHKSQLAEPKDLAHLLASYARDALARVEAAGDEPTLESVREALEAALGVNFKTERGLHFFHSTLVQTLFYGVFSAWVLWARQTPPPTQRFEWRKAVWYLRVPVLTTLFQQLAEPGRLRQLNLVEVLDWTADALGRVNRETFFSRFEEGEAVTYFYEPFLEAFDPELRKDLGVWYTPAEVVRYMVARVDKALKEDLGIADGLAAPNVYVLDPCCGTGAYLSEVLRRIAANLEATGAGAMKGARIREAAMQRVFGFEIMPAPLVVAHLQVGLTMQQLDAAFSDKGDERAGIFLSNALTGWEPKTTKPLPFPELEKERDRAKRVKQETRILVILGNPPYNNYAGMAIGEERELSEAYRTVKHVRKPEGQGLNDLYVRFFRMAERRIAEKTGQGVVSFISNYSWLDGLSFTGMRERYLDAFDSVRIDCLNGDKYKTGKTTPDSAPDPSIFSTKEDPIGIQVGTAITTLVRKADHAPTDTVGFRHLWGQTKREELTASAEAEPKALYKRIEPSLPLGLPFVPTVVSVSWHDCPALTDLFPQSFPGVTTNRDSFLVDIDLDRLKARIADYCDPDLNHEEIARRYPVAMKTTTSIPMSANTVREARLTRDGPNESRFVHYVHRPFDVRWLYYEDESGLLARPSPDYKPHVFDGNLWIEARRREAQEEFSRGTLVRHIAGDFGNGRSHFFPAYLREGDLTSDDTGRRPNLSGAAARYLDRIGMGVEDLFHHTLAVLHDPTYREQNAGALRMEWPRIPLPGWPDGDTDAAAKLAATVARGRELAGLLDPDTEVKGVTTGKLRPEIKTIAVPATSDGRQMRGDDFALTAGWGHFGKGGVVMPGKGKMEACADAFDVYLNARAYWQNIPAEVWNYKLGGYQVLKKWLSYREHPILGRPLHPEEVHHFTTTARRIAAILLATNRKE